MSFKTGHALIIGVGRYQHISQADVPIAAVDAQAVADVLVDPQHCGYPTGQVTVLQDHKATREAVLSALKKLAQTLSEQDTLFLFYVGHGSKGTDGLYYLTTHDSQVENGRVKKDTGVNEPELIDALRAIKAKRSLVILNACHSGEVSPNLDLPTETFESVAPPERLSTALLSSGEGRIIITACRPEQKSWIGNGKLSIFSQAVVGGLRGDEIFPNGGTISAYSLYEYVYQKTKTEANRQKKELQEPELTVLRGVGPFAVALYQGATDLGTFNDQETLPEDIALREVDEAQSKRMFDKMMQNYQYQATLHGDGAIAQGNNAKAVGKGGILIDGVTNGNITIGNNNRVND